MDRIAAQVKALANVADDATRKQFLDSLRDLFHSLEIPTDTLQRICYLPMQTALNRVAIEFKLFNILWESKDSLTAEILASKTGAAPLLLSRILRYLSSVGIIKETGKDIFTANNITNNLNIPAIQAGVYHNLDNCGPPALALTDFLKENNYRNVTEQTNNPLQKPSTQPTHTYFTEAHHSNKPCWFDVNSMAEKTKKVFFVDVGGRIGHYTVGLKKWFSWIRNCMIVQEMGVVLPTIIPCDGVEGMEYDFFIPQPVKDKCVAILKNIIPAMGPNSTILINDMVLPNSGKHWHRTVEQWYVLLEKAGLKIKRIWEHGEAVIECVPP
ncbi:hypothetical protein BDV06DRAFT_234674 [Aspergillus oleicola]